MNKLFLKYCFAIVALSAMLFTSCKDDEEALQQSRLFMPISMSVDTTSTSVTVKWKPFSTDFQGPTKGYELLVSDDPTFPIGSTQTYQSTEPFYTITSGPVIENTEVYDFYAKVRAISENTATGNSQFTEAFMFTPYRENIFNSVRKEDISNSFIVFRWKPDVGETTADVKKIVLNFPDGSSHVYAISSEEKEANKKQINGLEAVSTYTAYIYNDTKRRGRLMSTTRSANEIIVDPSDFLDQVKNVQPGWILRLKPGNYDFSTSTVTINKSISLESYADEAPILSIGKFALRETIGKFSLNGITFTGNGTTSDFIEMSKADDANGIGEFVSIDSLVIEDCSIGNFTKSFIIYSSTANLNTATIKNILINNSIIHDVNANGTQGAQAIDLRNYIAQNIKITKSTFYNQGRTLLRMGAADKDQKFELSNCTFYNYSPGTQYLIDFTVSANFGVYVIKNNIFAKTSTSGKGFRIGDKDSGATTEYSYNDEYDVNYSGNATPTVTWTETKNILKQDPAFVDPANGNFTLPKSSSLRTAASNGGPLGDPRWAK